MKITTTKLPKDGKITATTTELPNHLSFLMMARLMKVNYVSWIACLNGKESQKLPCVMIGNQNFLPVSIIIKLCLRHISVRLKHGLMKLFVRSGSREFFFKKKDKLTNQDLLHPLSKIISEFSSYTQIVQAGSNLVIRPLLQHLKNVQNICI